MTQRTATRRPAPRPTASRGPRVASPDARLRVALLVVLFVMSLFVGRLVQLQGLDASALASEALGNRLREVTVPAVRGDITDAAGVVLAGTVERRDVVVDQQVVGEYKKKVAGSVRVVGVDGAAEDLAPLLGMSVDEVAEKLTGDRRYVVVKKKVTPEVWRQVAELGIPGIIGERSFERVYPAGNVAGSLIGFLGDDGTPLAGLEMTRDDVLSGTDGMQRYEIGRGGQRIWTDEASQVDPVPGGDVRLTLDRDLQWYAQQVIADQVTATGAQWGSVVAIEVETGNILAFAEAPSVDPNDPGASPAEDRGTRALSDVIEPGSTAKVITAAAAIEEGLVRPEDRFEVPYTYTTDNGQTFRDSSPHGLEKLTFAGILGKSSNTGTVMVGERMDRQTRYDYLTRFGMGQPTGLGFPGETKGILHPPEAWDGRTQYAVLFGQGFSLNMLQSAQVFATLANDGVRVTPRLVAGTTDPDGTYRPAPEPETVRVVSPETAATVRSMLEGAVGEGGTGGNAAVPGYRIAGKTGTAQAPSPTGGYSGYTSSFIGMAPADDPKIVVAVTLQRPVNGYYGGVVAAPVFSDVMAFALQQRRVPPTGAQPALVPLEWE
ncbi:MAG: peptidoglycan D,D-transpeptidase FtsI family protein [Actinomycetota bacterium]